MKTLEIIMVTILFIHQTLDIIGIKGYVARPKLKSPDTIGWLILVILMVLYYLQIAYIPFILIILFGLVLLGLYNFHWKLFFFGASEQKLKGYNEFFKGTHRIWPESNTRLVPDTYHIVHTVIYFITFVVMVVNQITELF